MHLIFLLNFRRRRPNGNNFVRAMRHNSGNHTNSAHLLD